MRAFPSRFELAFPGFSLAPRRGLWVFVVATPLLAAAALNTGNNALYLLLSLAMGAFVASGSLSRHTLRHLSATLLPPAEAFAGSPVQLHLEVRNSSRWLAAAGVVCRLPGLPGEALVPPVPPRGAVRVALATAFPRRGRHPLPPVRVEVRLPLGFFVKSVTLRQEGELLVFPRRVAGPAPRWVSLGERELSGFGRLFSRGGEVQQLREFRPGDDRRDVHWKQTARQQRPIVMERRERRLSSRFLVLDRELPRRDDPILLARFEDLVSEVATAALDALRRGEGVGLVLGGTVLPPATGVAHTRRLLEALALVEAVGPGEDPLPPLATQGGVYRLTEER